MRVSTAIVSTLVGAGTALGMAIDKSSAQDLDRRGSQVATLYYCLPSGGGEEGLEFAVFEQDTSVKGPCDLGDAAINKPGDNTSLMAYTDFEFRAYGATCRFFVDTDFDGAPDGYPVGHADCPVDGDVKGYKKYNQNTQPLADDRCGRLCYSQIEITLDGAI